MKMVNVDGVRYRPEHAPKKAEPPQAKARTSGQTSNKARPAPKAKGEDRGES